MPDASFIVYALSDPREPDRIRYIGMTGDLTRRMVEHGRGDRSCKRKAPWLAELAALGLTPVVRELSRHATRDEARIAEWRTIKATRTATTCDLNGLTPPPGCMNWEADGSLPWPQRWLERYA